MKNKSSWFTMAATGPDSAELTLYGEVGYFPDDANTFRRALKALGDGVKQLAIRINSPGGSVIDGWAIYNMLRDHPAQKTAYIDGWAASMASIIAMAADTVVQPRNTWLMIHNPWTVAVGDSDSLRKMAGIMDSMKAHAVEAYQRHVKASAEVISAWMDAETWLTGDDAKALGWDHEITDPLAVSACVTTGKLSNVPADAMAWVAAAAPPVPAEATEAPKEEAADVSPEPVAASQEPGPAADPEPAADDADPGMPEDDEDLAVWLEDTGDAFDAGELAGAEAAFDEGHAAGLAEAAAAVKPMTDAAAKALGDAIAERDAATAALEAAKTEAAAALATSTDAAAKALADANAAHAAEIEAAQAKAAADLAAAKAEAAAALDAEKTAHAATAAKLEKLGGGLNAPPLDAVGGGDWESVMAAAQGRGLSYNAAYDECIAAHPDLHAAYIAAHNPKKRTRK